MVNSEKKVGQFLRLKKKKIVVVVQRPAREFFPNCFKNAAFQLLSIFFMRTF